MAKLIKKKKCEFIDGYIVKKNRQVGIPYAVYHQLNRLEFVLQQYRYLKGQPAYCEGPSIKGFKLRSNFDHIDYEIATPDTPTIDARVAEAMKFMEEADKVATTNEINEAIEKYRELIVWLDSPRFFEGECLSLIDLPELGNPLNLKAEEVILVLRMIISDPIVIEE